MLDTYQSQRKCVNDVGVTKGCKAKDIKCLCAKNDELIEPGADCIAIACPDDVTPMMVTEITFDICDCMAAAGALGASGPKSTK